MLLNSFLEAHRHFWGSPRVEKAQNGSDGEFLAGLTSEKKIPFNFFQFHLTLNLGQHQTDSISLGNKLSDQSVLIKMESGPQFQRFD